MKKNIALDTNRLDTFYKQLAIARTAITKAVATTTKSSPKPTQSLDKKAIKQEYYKNVVLAANTLLGQNLPNESELIIEYNIKIQNIKADQARLETKSYVEMKKTAEYISNSESKRELARSSLASTVVSGMTEQQIADMRREISEGLMKLTMYMRKYNGMNKALYEKQINDYNTQFQESEQIISNKGYKITDTDKLELKKLEQNVLTLVKILEKTLDPKNIVKTRMILPNKLGYTSLYGMTSEKMNSLLQDTGRFKRNTSTYRELLRILNEMDPATININEALNPNVVKLLNFINGLTNAAAIYMEIKIEIRDSILQQIIKNNKISDYEDIVVNILKSMNDNDLSTFENNPTIPDKFLTILQNINISKLTNFIKAEILRLINENKIATLGSYKIEELFKFNNDADNKSYITITIQKIIKIINALDITILQQFSDLVVQCPLYIFLVNNPPENQGLDKKITDPNKQNHIRNILQNICVQGGVEGAAEALLLVPQSKPAVPARPKGALGAPTARPKGALTSAPPGPASSVPVAPAVPRRPVASVSGASARQPPRTSALGAPTVVVAPAVPRRPVASVSGAPLGAPAVKQGALQPPPQSVITKQPQRIPGAPAQTQGLRQSPPISARTNQQLKASRLRYIQSAPASVVAQPQPQDELTDEEKFNLACAFENDVGTNMMKILNDKSIKANVQQSVIKYFEARNVMKTTTDEYYPIKEKMGENSPEFIEVKAKYTQEEAVYKAAQHAMHLLLTPEQYYSLLTKDEVKNEIEKRKINNAEAAEVREKKENTSVNISNTHKVVLTDYDKVYKEISAETHGPIEFMKKFLETPANINTINTITIKKYNSIGNLDYTPEFKDLANTLYSIGYQSNKFENAAYIKYAAMGAMHKNQENVDIVDAFLANELPKKGENPDDDTADDAATQNDAIFAAKRNIIESLQAKQELPNGAVTLYNALYGKDAVSSIGNDFNTASLPQYVNSLDFDEWDTLIKKFFTLAANNDTPTQQNTYMIKGKQINVSCKLIAEEIIAYIAENNEQFPVSYQVSYQVPRVLPKRVLPKLPQVAVQTRTFNDVLNNSRIAADGSNPRKVNNWSITFIKTLQNDPNIEFITTATAQQISEIAGNLYNIGETPAQKAYIKYAALGAIIREGEFNKKMKTNPIVYSPNAFVRNILPVVGKIPVAFVKDDVPTEDDAMHAATAAVTNGNPPGTGYTALMNAVYGNNNYDQSFAIENHFYAHPLEFAEWDNIIKPFITAITAIPGGSSGAVIANNIITAIANNNAIFQLGGAKRSRHSKSKRHHKSKKHNTNNKKVSRKHRNLKSKYNSKSKKNNKNTKRRKSKHH